MRAEITRGGKSLRPSFNHYAEPGNSYPPTQITAQMTESLRNLSESYFADFLVAHQETLRVLKRIDRRLAQQIKLPGGRRTQ
jgi:hypothetical protein